MAATIALTVQAGESKAQLSEALADPVSCAATALNTAACNPLVGDKQFSDFTFTGFTPAAGDTVSFRQTAPTAFSMQYNFDPGRSAPNATGTFGYKITIIEPFKSLGFRFLNAQANITGGTIGGGALNTVASSTALTGGSVSSTSGPGPIDTFIDDTFEAVFSQTFSALGGNDPTADIESFGLRFRQNKEFTTSSVPGPLPILGAGAAFGLSRKMRRRIKQAA
ncbi:hypothetical protein KBY95_08560 [Cyanobium sp. Aljojuca 7A6]|nr:hypothetical protein [Cyanobium sp. Aljojuca 7A6]